LVQPPTRKSYESSEFIALILPWRPPNNQFKMDGSMVKQPFPVKICIHHPLEIAIYKELLRVPGPTSFE